jgi:hypothetical protein
VIVVADKWGQADYQPAWTGRGAKKQKKGAQGCAPAQSVTLGMQDAADALPRVWHTPDRSCTPPRDEGPPGDQGCIEEEGGEGDADEDPRGSEDQTMQEAGDDHEASSACADNPSGRAAKAPSTAAGFG